MLGSGADMTVFWVEIDFLLYIMSYNILSVHINAISILGAFYTTCEYCREAAIC